MYSRFSRTFFLKKRGQYAAYFVKKKFNALKNNALKL